ncbi:DinB family protein [Alkalihalophilus lindianensis]|uniref:DinB family protein n=1 Tax=Alkalihalophilus lindianensis TaxID=1630542 RepID=A0ABU3X4V1_9BACI|nr:DinB family protein [Alkalihalophilus lindianensis]MDV2682924.1 DinB family protein [Alkalihalophilus lindianensis]
MNETLTQLGETVTVIANLKDQEDSQLLAPIKQGKWSIREIVAHLYYWDQFNLESMIPYMNDGASLPPFPDHDAHNQEAINDVHGQSVYAIIDQFVAAREKFMEHLESIGEDVRFTIGGGKRTFSVESFAKVFLKHDIHHLKQIEEKVK